MIKKIQKKSAKDFNNSLYLFIILLFFICIPLEFSFYLLNFCFITLTLFKLIIFLLFKQIKTKTENILFDYDWPYYSVLLPLYKEESIVEQLINKIQEIDYPKEKLDVIIVLEEDDKATLDCIKKIKHDFNIVVVPESFPKTKGKACNYAIQFVKGSFLTIYDAEDIPDKFQLKTIVQKFSFLNEDYAAIQASLQYYNADYNFLTKLFSLEYSLQFDYILPSLENLGGFVPLGGSSNHLKVKEMNKIGWWDGFNVTEDIDIATRIFVNNKKISCIDSITLEQSPITISAWIKQRSRWIKGFLQTFIVHMNSPLSFLNAVKWKKFVSFNLITIIPIICNLFFPLFFLLLFISEVDSKIYCLSYINFLFAVIVNLVIYIIIINRFKWNTHYDALIFIPFYWILYFFATIKAVYELIKKPYYWDKTDHLFDKK